MELVQYNLGDILGIIKSNFWQLLIIFALLRKRDYFKYGLVLLYIHLFYGYKWYCYLGAYILTLVFHKSENDINDEIYNRLEDLENKIDKI